jgi:hypothetical protein
MPQTNRGGRSARIRAPDKERCGISPPGSVHAGGLGGNAGKMAKQGIFTIQAPRVWIEGNKQKPE